MDGLGNFIFFSIINGWLSNRIYAFQTSLLTNMTMAIGGITLGLITVWIMFHGYRIVTGQSQQPLMMLVGDSLRATLIVMAATTMGVAGSQVWNITDGISTQIVQVVTGSSEGPFQRIDNNLAAMQMGMSTIDTIEAGGNGAIQSDLNRDKWISGIGVAGPAVVAGSLLLLNKIALALFVGLGPLFILCLLFKQTAPLFQKWLLYGIGTVFSLAVLSVMVTIAMDMLTAVTAAYIAQYVAAMGVGSALGVSTSTDGLNSIALQQGGIGLILTTLLISAPPMAASFFQGTLGQFQSYSPFGRIGEGAASSRQQTGLFSHPAANAQLPGNNSGGGKGDGSSNNLQITGASGYRGGGDGYTSGAYGQAGGQNQMGPGT
jgi:type IV secretion system protein VirB6